MAEDPADIDLDRFAAENVEPAVNAPAPRRRGPSRLVLIGLALVLAIAGAYVYLRRPHVEAPSAGEKPSPPPAARQGLKGDSIVLPPLDETDPVIRQLVSRLSSHPTMLAWLTTDGLILNFVMVAAGVANGESRTAELKAIGPVPRFRIRETRDGIYLDPASYRRYDRYADAFVSLDARESARLYATLKPRITDAYRRLDNAGGDFDPVLERAIVELLRVPVIESELELVPKATVYAFADPKLEAMTAAQKQLLRMGPQNVRRIQEKLRDIADYLAIPAAKLR